MAAKLVKPKVPEKAKPKAAAPAVVAKGAPAAIKPIKTALTKAALIAHLAETTGETPKAAKGILNALEATILASVCKRGFGSFSLPGVLKVVAVAIPAKKKRRGIDPFTKVERDFPAKPATVRVKVRALKKLKDAAL